MKPVLSIVLMVLLIFQRGSGLSVLREDGGSGVSCFDKECNDENSSIDGIEYEGEKGEYICVDYQDRLSTTAAPTTAAPTTAAPTTATETTAAPTTASEKTAAPTTATETTAAPTTATETTAAPTTATKTTAAPTTASTTAFTTTAAPTTTAQTTATPTTTAPTTAPPTTAAPTTAATTTAAETTTTPTPASSTTAAPTTTTPTTTAFAPTDDNSPKSSESSDSSAKPSEKSFEEKHVHKIFRLKNVLTKGNLMDGDEKKQCALKPKEGKICDVIKHYYEECTESEPSSGKSISVGFSLFVILVFSVLFLE